MATRSTDSSDVPSSNVRRRFVVALSEGRWLARGHRSVETGAVVGRRSEAREFGSHASATSAAVALAARFGGEPSVTELAPIPQWDGRIS